MWTEGESNPRPPDCEPGVLPTELPAQVFIFMKPYFNSNLTMKQDKKAAILTLSVCDKQLYPIKVYVSCFRNKNDRKYSPIVTRTIAWIPKRNDRYSKSPPATAPIRFDPKAKFLC